jgi:hypothetical protein
MQLHVQAIAPNKPSVDCSNVLGPPPAPVTNPRASVDQNIAAVQARGSGDPGSYMSNMAWWSNQVRDAGNWDYKNGLAESTPERLSVKPLPIMGTSTYCLLLRPESPCRPLNWLAKL